MNRLKKPLIALLLLALAGTALVVAGSDLFFTSRIDITKGIDLERLPKGTRKMIEILQEKISSEDVLSHPFFLMNEKSKIKKLFKKLSWLSKKAKRDSSKEIAYTLLLAGSTEESIKEMESLVQNNGISLNDITPSNAEYLRFLALAYLRKGEQYNCLMNHNAQSCIVPFAKNAEHLNKDGAERSLRYLTMICEAYPEDLTSRWLLNVACMALGQYPHYVPKNLLVPLHDNYSKNEIRKFPGFTDIAGKLGLDVNDLSGSVIIDDFNNDGYFDLMVSSAGLAVHLRYFENSGKGDFIDKSTLAGLTGLTGGLNLMQVDYNNDGLLDFFVPRGAWLGPAGQYPNSLIKNLGRGAFEDVTIESGLLSYHSTQVACWADFNLDGWLDLFIGNERSDFSERGFSENLSELYLNNADGTFTNVAAKVGLSVSAIVKGATWTDYNNDGLPDLFISVLGSDNKLFKNEGGSSKDDWKFTDVSSEAGINGPKFSFPVMSFDFNNDGWEDIFVGDFDMRFVGGYDKMRNGEWSSSASQEFVKEMLGMAVGTQGPALYKNNGDGTFSNIAKEMQLHKVLFAMGCNFGDLDNDGFLDFYIGTGTPNYESIIPNRMFRNAGGRFFEDVSFSGGFGHIQKGHGISFADIDNDGDQDIYAVMGGMYQGDVFPNVLFENPGHGNSWISIKLQGVESNKNGVGARINVVASGTNGQEQHFHRTVSSGGSFGANPLQIHIGLGDATKVKSITIQWPGKRSLQNFENIAVNQFLIITENSNIVKIIDRPAIDFSSVISNTHQRHH